MEAPPGRYLASHYPKCAACGTSYGIEVHHRTYDVAFHGQELDADLVAVCQDPHDLFETGAYASLGRRDPGDARRGQGCWLPLRGVPLAPEQIWSLAPRRR